MSEAPHAAGNEIGDLNTVTTVADLAAVLRRLKRRHARRSGDSELTIRELAARTGYAVGAVGSYFKGTTLAPTDRFDVLAQLLGANAQEQRALANARDAVADRRVTPVIEPAFSPRQLPAAAGWFVGRAAELRQLDEMLGLPGKPEVPVRTAVISGLPGVGKTTLAVHWAHRVASHFPDGCLYADLQGYAAPPPEDPGKVLGAFRRGLGLNSGDIPVALEERAGRYRTLLHERRILIILDNAVDADQVRPLLPAGTSALLVVTSRANLEGLIVHPGARLIRLDLISTSDAVKLLRVRIGDRIADDTTTVEALVHEGGQLPLALSIIAAMVETHPDRSLGALAAELVKQRARLDIGDPATSLDTVFSWSYRQLHSGARRLFRLLGLAPGADFGIHAAAALLDANLDAAWQSIDALLRANLLDEPRPGRYAMHSLLRDYAAGLSASEDTTAERDRALDQMLSVQLHTACVAMDLIAPTEHERRPRVPAPGKQGPSLRTAAEATTWLDTERSNLVAAAIDAASRGRAEYTGDLSVTLGRYLDVGGHYEESKALHKAALSTAPDPRTLINLGTVHARLGEYPEAASVYKRALEAARDAGDNAGAGRVLINLGSVCWLTGSDNEALGYYNDALALARASGDRNAESLLLINIGNVHRRLNHHEQAQKYFQQALSFAERWNDRATHCAALVGLGDLNLLLGHHQPAIEHHDRALEIAREIGDHQLELAALTSMGKSLRLTGQPTRALDHYRAAAALARDRGDRHEQARALEGAAEAASMLGDEESAQRYWLDALRIFQDLGATEADTIKERLLGS